MKNTLNLKLLISLTSSILMCQLMAHDTLLTPSVHNGFSAMIKLAGIDSDNTSASRANALAVSYSGINNSNIAFSIDSAQTTRDGDLFDSDSYALRIGTSLNNGLLVGTRLVYDNDGFGTAGDTYSWSLQSRYPIMPAFFLDGALDFVSTEIGDASLYVGDNDFSAYSLSAFYQVAAQDQLSIQLYSTLMGSSLESAGTQIAGGVNVLFNSGPLDASFKMSTQSFDRGVLISNNPTASHSITYRFK